MRPTHRAISLVSGSENLAPGPSSSSSEISGLGDDSGVAASVAKAAEPFCAGKPSPTVLRDETWWMNQSCECRRVSESTQGNARWEVSHETRIEGAEREQLLRRRDQVLGRNKAVALLVELNLGLAFEGIAHLLVVVGLLKQEHQQLLRRQSTSTRKRTEMPRSSSKQALRSIDSAHVADILSGELFSPSVGSRAVRSASNRVVSARSKEGAATDEPLNRS